MPIALRGKWKAMQGKCERGYESANADGVGAEGFAGDGCSQERLSAPWPRFHGVDRADVYIIIHVRACCCGECELNPPPSPPIPRRRSSLTPPHSDTPFPSTSAPPRSPDARPQAARCIPRRPYHPFPAAPRCLPFCSASGTKKRHRTASVRCRMFRSTVVAVGHLGW